MVGKKNNTALSCNNSNIVLEVPFFISGCIFFCLISDICSFSVCMQYAEVCVCVVQDSLYYLVWFLYLVLAQNGFTGCFHAL